jgi:hypothetical protein
MSGSASKILNRLAASEGSVWYDNLSAESWLTRQEASTALKSIGFDVSAATLASLATRGHGPKYRLFMGVAKSRWGDLLEWAESRSIYRGGETVAA